MTGVSTLHSDRACCGSSSESAISKSSPLHVGGADAIDASTIKSMPGVASRRTRAANADECDKRAIDKVLALLSGARAVRESLHAERREADAGWKWLCLATRLKAVMDAINQARETSPAFRERIYRRWIRLCEARPDPAIYWGFIDIERDRCAQLEGAMFRCTVHGERSIWIIDGGIFDGYAASDISAKAIKWLAQYVAELDVQ